MSEGFIFIPEHIRKKRIPNNNTNPLYELSKDYNIKFFEDISKDLLIKTYNNDKVLFFKLIDQLAFFGVRFNNQFEKYNLIPKDDKKVFKSTGNGFLSYNELLDNKVVQFMRKYGLIKNKDINGLYFNSIKLKANKPIELQNFVNVNNLKLVHVEELTISDFDYTNEKYNEFEYIKEEKNDLLNKNLIENIFRLKNDNNIDSLSEKELLVLVNRFINYYGGLSIYKLVELIKSYSSFLGIDNIENLSKKNITNIINKNDSLNWDNDYSSIVKFLKQFNYNEQEISLTDMLNFNNKISYYFYFDKLNKIDYLDSEINSLNFSYKYICELQKFLNRKGYEKLLYNYISNVERPVNIEELVNNLSMINDIGKKEITNLLKKSDEFALVDLNKWNLKKHSNFEIKGNFLDDLNHILNNSKFSKRNINIFKSRTLKMKTLEEVGGDVDLTRERVRQINKKIIKSLQHHTNFKYIKPYFNFIDEIFNREILVSKERFNKIDFFDGLNSDQVIKLYNEINSENLTELKKDYFIKENNKKQINIENLINNLPKIIKAKHFEEILKNKGIKISYIKILDILLQFNYVYKYKEFIFFAPNKSDMVEIVIKLFFKKKIKFNRDFSKFKKYLNDIFDNKFKNDSKRSIRALLQRENSNIIVWGHGDYIHTDNTCINKDNLIQIKDAIKTKLEETPEVNINSVYIEYEKYVNKLNITNKRALYFLLKYYFNNELYFYRFPRVFDIGYKEKEIPDNYIMIKNYIKNKGRAVSKKELFDYFVDQIGWEEYAVYNNLGMNEDIIYVGNEKYVYIEDLDFDKNELNEIAKWIENILDSNFPEIKVDSIYENNIVQMKSANIRNKNILLNLLKYYFKNKFDFRGTHVSITGVDKTIVDRVTNFIKSYENGVFKDEIIKEFKNYHLSKGQIYHILYKEEDIVKFNTNEYIHVDNLNVDNSEIQRLFETLEEILESNIYNFASIIYDVLPAISDKWTKDLVVDILKRSNKYYFLGSNINKYIVIKKDNEHNITDNVSFLNYLLSEKYSRYVEKSELKDYLLRIGFIFKNLPIEYRTNDDEYPYFIENNEIILKNFDYN